MLDVGCRYATLRHIMAMNIEGRINMKIILMLECHDDALPARYVARFDADMPLRHARLRSAPLIDNATRYV